MDITDNSERWLGRDAYDAEGYKLGGIDAIYHDDETGRPEWVAIKSRSHDRLVPLAGATTHLRPGEEPDPDDAEQPEDLRLAFGSEQIEAAPDVVLDDDDHLDAETEQLLYAHYGLPYAAAATTRASRLRRYGRIGEP